jgi:hypothetical protein
MEVERVRSPEADRLLVRCDDRMFGEALVDLAFGREDDGFAKRFPPGSVTDSILARFEGALVPLLRQTARLDAAPWREALREAARRLDASGVDWWLTGSAALAVRGLQLEPRDLDLVVAEPDVTRTAEAFATWLIEPVVETEGWIARWFGRAWLGARVEWIAGVSKAADQPHPSDFGPAAASALTRIEWEGLDVRIPPLALQRDVAVRRGLADRVALIDSLA